MSIFYFFTGTLLSHSSLALIIIIIVLLIITKRYNSRKNEEYWTKRNIRIGQTPAIAKTIKGRDMHLIDQELVKTYGKVFGVYRFGAPTIFCTDPQLLSNILSKDFTIFRNRRYFYFNDELMDNNMSLLRDDHWKRIRSIVSPTFSSGKLRKMRPIIDECIEILINDFNRLIADSSEVDIKVVFGSFTMNAIARIAFGTKVDALNDETNPLIVNSKAFISRDFKLLDLPKLMLMTKFPSIGKFLNLKFHSESASKFFTDLTKKLLKQRRANKSALKRYDFLQLLIDAMETDENSDDNIDTYIDANDKEVFEQHISVPLNNKTMSVSEITAQCALFFRAGYETTAATLSYIVYNLASNQRVQQKLYEEIKNVLESQTQIDYDLIHTLKYLDAVISESLRLYPPGASLTRTASENYTLDKDVKLFKGDIIHIPVYSMHRDAQYFSEPESFKPERFLPENRSHHPYAYLPFGAGPRNCVAQRLALLEAKFAVLYLVYNFQFSCSHRTEHPPQTYSNAGLVFPRSILLNVEKRQ